MIHERLPAVARTITQKLLDDAEHDGCLGELNLLDHHGSVGRQVGAVADGSATAAREHCRARWQYYASSASEHFFRRTVVLGHAGAANQAHLRSHFRPWVVVRVEWDSNQPRVQSGTSPLPHAGPLENEVASARGRIQMRVRGRFGQLGASPCCVSQVRTTTHQIFGTRKDTGQDLLGGGSHCAMQCQAEGHGHRSVCTGREGNRSSRSGAPFQKCQLISNPIVHGSHHPPHAHSYCYYWLAARVVFGDHDVGQIGVFALFIARCDLSLSLFRQAGVHGEYLGNRHRQLRLRHWHFKSWFLLLAFYGQIVLEMVSIVASLLRD